MTTFTAFTNPMGNTDSGYGGQTPGCNCRNVLPTSALSGSYKGWVTAAITIKSQTGSNGSLASAWIGGSGGGTNNINFKGDQAKIFWGGVGNLTLSGAQTYAVSDQ